jgi:hypothetical protein
LAATALFGREDVASYRADHSGQSLTYVYVINVSDEKDDIIGAII